MDMLTAAIVGLSCLAVGIAVGAVIQRNNAATPPPRAWKGHMVTPVMLGPRNKAPERVGRRMVLTQAVLLAAHMAHIDGEVTESETTTIRQFILDHVTGADQEFTERVMRDGFSATVSAAVIDAAIETVKAVGSAEQRELIIQLMAAVARADGTIDPRERSFMIEMGTRLGLNESHIDQMLKLS